MRIEKIRFLNLNSLVGEWEIDLTHPAFASDGIFAITGPTGSGKTTILDAVCLALYGRTPRLNRVTKSGNEIMSRQTGECFAEVTFRTGAGCFRCHWSQRRARKKPGGELQAPKHEIADGETGVLFESKIRGVAGQIEEATGMDFDRFTRSMLLAQGGFAAFLQAAPDERAPILEQITGTEIYSLISMEVHERLRDERDKLTLLQAETAGIVILQPEEEEALRRDLADKAREEEAAAGRLEKTAKAMNWLTTLDGLEKEISGLAEEETELQGEWTAFAPDQERLRRAMRAASLEGPHATLEALRKRQVDDSEALKAEEESLPELESLARDGARALLEAELATIRAKEELDGAAPLLAKVRSLDQWLSDRRNALADMEEECRQDSVSLDKARESREEKLELLAAEEERLERAERGLKEHGRDEWLVGGLAGVEEQVNALISLQKEIADGEDALEREAETLRQAKIVREECRERTGVRREDLEAVSQRLRREKEELDSLLDGRLLREYRAEKEALLREMAFLTRIAELEDYRARLEDGMACPLCGSLEHPFAEGNIPLPDETERKIAALEELIGEAEGREAAVQRLEKAEAAARQQVTEGEKDEAAALSAQNAAEKALALSAEGLEKLRADCLRLQSALETRLQPLGISEIPEGDLPSLAASLRERLNAWQEKIREKADIEKKIGLLKSDLKWLDGTLETLTRALEKKKMRVETLQKEYDCRLAERKNLYGEKDPDEEERRLKDTLEAAGEAEKKARKLREGLKERADGAKSRVESLKKGILRREPEVNKAEAAFSAGLSAAGFENEEDFLEARLDPDRRDALAARKKNLEDRRTALAARRADRERKLEEERARQVTDETLEVLEPRFRECEDLLKTLRDEVSALRHRLNENAAAAERVKEKKAALEVQGREYRRWDCLHELIGSADGKKYRNFAQGLTFDMMISQANRQLQKMSDRYLLVRDREQPLELNVVDGYQAGEIRSTKNLSGGESFIVSLALALGLSSMASRNVRVDSLFLDEGFGTLDEEALDTALETLAGLQQDGKLIGVISHVPALKERISARIEVVPRTGGRSLITGPGCLCLSS
ncbi:AAA family ATPase [Aminivibrio sp.]|uniref:AAA family ATPase n=1 Tax=Aminivibrio sp. TaxID=1872489 RepID=UPI001A3EADF4|nr:AAA family ATPase [Aminivibrio sp.]MBL3539037.1 AAA family ATPase [Aminivibrio sp.]